MEISDRKNLFFTQTALFALLVWAGMVAGISFVEAPVKFSAPQVTLAIGLGIGRLVFGWLNRFELFFCALTLLSFYCLQVPRNIWQPAGLLVAVLALQTGWLLPALDVRALAIIAGENPPANQLHVGYVGLEIFKSGLLLGTARAVFRHQFGGLTANKPVYA